MLDHLPRGFPPNDYSSLSLYSSNGRDVITTDDFPFLGVSDEKDFLSMHSSLSILFTKYVLYDRHCTVMDML